MSAQQIESENFFASLFDFDFTSFVTLRFMKVIYALLVTLILLFGLHLRRPPSQRELGRSRGGDPRRPCGHAALLILARVTMEMVALFFRIGENTSLLVQRSDQPFSTIPSEPRNCRHLRIKSNIRSIHPSGEPMHPSSAVRRHDPTPTPPPQPTPRTPTPHPTTGSFRLGGRGLEPHRPAVPRPGGEAAGRGERRSGGPAQRPARLPPPPGRRVRVPAATGRPTSRSRRSRRRQRSSLPCSASPR